MNKSSKITLIVTTICIVFIHAANLIDYLETGDKGGVVSNTLFVLGTIFLVVAWISYFRKHKQE